jgi:hypothetical protein
MAVFTLQFTALPIYMHSIVPLWRNLQEVTISSNCSPSPTKWGLLHWTTTKQLLSCVEDTVGTSHSPNTHSLLLRSMWEHPTVQHTIPTPSAEQLQSLLLRPDNPYSQIHAIMMQYLYSMANGNSSWCQSQSQGINTSGTACQSQSQLRYYSSTSRYHASTPPAISSAALQPTMKALSASLHITRYRLSVRANQHGPRRQPPPCTIQKRPLWGPRLAQCWYRASAPKWWYSDKHKDSHSAKT